MDVRIRPASTIDLPILVQLLAELFSIEVDFTPSAEAQRLGLALMLTDPRQRIVLVAEHARAGAVIGMVTGQLMVSTAEGGLSVLVEDMVVEAAHRGAGVGRALLKAVEGWAAERGATRMQLLADRENAPALAFYRREGWSSTQLVCMRRHPGGAGAERPDAGDAQDARDLSGT